jgi:16S rRNA (cytidine1402-2'-O)-methyltransferase
LAKLYLIPTILGETAFEKVLPSEVNTIVRKLRYFVVEDVRTARRHLKKMVPEIVIDDLDFRELNEHSRLLGLETLLDPIEQGFDVGILSEAGCPGVADPGADLVKIAHEKGIQVVPLVGPSSILLSLMASGMNGQRFRFHGYLPQDGSALSARLRELERDAGAGETQMFIETPYRTERLFESILAGCNAATRLCVALDLGTTDEAIGSMSVGRWKNLAPEQRPGMRRRPAVFLLHAGPAPGSTTK